MLNDKVMVMSSSMSCIWYTKKCINLTKMCRPFSIFWLISCPVYYNRRKTQFKIGFSIPVTNIMQSKPSISQGRGVHTEEAQACV